MLTPVQKARIELFAVNGGFSMKFIASLVFNTSFGDVTTEEKRRVSAYLSANKIRLRDWRNGVSNEARAHVRATTPQRIRRRA